MNKITLVGLDLAKSVFHLVAVDKRGKQLQRKMLKRRDLLKHFANLPQCTVAMEACASAHHWARALEALGHEVRLIAPQHVKPYVQGNKNDYNDAGAIAEAASRPQMPFVQPKSIEQQDVQALIRLRERRVGERTGVCNQLRGLLAEYGLIAPKGVHALRKAIPEFLEDAQNGLSDRFRRLLAQGYDQLQQLEEHLAFYDRELRALAKQDEAIERLQSVPAFGPVVASVFRARIGDGRAYAKGRDVSAALGIVPRQHSSGGKNVLLGISKRGDKYLRTLLIHGARSVVQHAAGKDDRLSRWVCRIEARRGRNKAIVALANKLARIAWAILRNNDVYRPDYAGAQP